MMANLIKYVYEILNSDLILRTNLGQWNFGDGVLNPAIFTSDQIPGEVQFPIVTIMQDGGDLGWISRAEKGGPVNITIRIYGNKTGSNKGLAFLSHYIWELIRSYEFNLNNDYIFMGANASPPFFIQDDEGFPGYEIPLTIEIAEI